MNDPIACLAVMPGVSGRARAFALEATQRHVARGMAGYSATDGDKARLTAQAIDIFNSSKSNPTSPMLRGQIEGAFSELNAYDSWTDTSHFWSFGTWYDKQTVRSNLQQALVNVDIATGTTTAGDPVSPTWRPQTEGMTPVDVNVEFVKNIPGELSTAAKCVAQGMRYDGEKCVPIVSTDALKKIIVVAVVGLLAIGAGYVAITSYAQGRGARPAALSNRGRGRRNPPSSSRRPRPGTVRYRVARRAA